MTTPKSIKLKVNLQQMGEGDFKYHIDIKPMLGNKIKSYKNVQLIILRYIICLYPVKNL